MIELLSPAGSMDALRAAVQNGADAVYLGTDGFNARMGARNFQIGELADVVRMCHVRGVQVHLTLNTLVLDREMDAAISVIDAAAEAGVDAFIVQDFGLARLCRRRAPQVAVHASTQMSIHSISGVLQAADMGVSRVVLARELGRAEIAKICAMSPVEIEVFVHGALCMCYSGQCYFSGVIGRRSGNRGGCAQPCRMNYGYGRYEIKNPLSLKDNCLLEYVHDLEEMGVSSLKIEGRMKRPEYVAVVTRIYRAVLDGAPVTETMLSELERAFSREGFTKGYYEGKLGRDMFGVHLDTPEDRELYARARASYEGTEVQRVGVAMEPEFSMGQPSRLICTDEQGRQASAEGPEPELARNHSLTAEEIGSRLTRTGGTPYRVTRCAVHVDPGLIVSASAINGLRRDALLRLTSLRGDPAPYQPGTVPPVMMDGGQSRAPGINIQVRSADQITKLVLDARPELLYVPLHEIAKHPELLQKTEPGTALCAVLPRIIWDSERDGLREQLRSAVSAGVRDVLVGNLGHVALLQSLRVPGLRIRGDYGLNLFNSRTAAYLKELGLASVTASFELTLPQIRDLSKPVPTEILVYGRLPLMITQNCVIQGRTGTCTCDTPVRLYDRMGEGFPVLREAESCRSEIFNSKKLYLLDKQAQLQNLGLWALRLCFTTEHSGEVDEVLRTMEQGGQFDPGGHTRGLYARGVE